MAKKQIQKKKVNKKKQPKITTAYSPELKNVILITVIVLFVLAAVYFFTALATGKIQFGKDDQDETETTIQYEEILAGESFDQAEESYLVLFYYTDGVDAGLYDTLLSVYQSKENALPYYRVDMTNALNQMYRATEGSNLYVSRALDLKISEPALIHFVNHQVSVVYEGKEAITEYFNQFGQ